jgi:hypothetical protein
MLDASEMQHADFSLSQLSKLHAKLDVLLNFQLINCASSLRELVVEICKFMLCER